MELTASNPRFILKALLARHSEGPQLTSTMPLELIIAMNRKQLQSKLSTVTSELLKEKGYISFIDVFMKLDYLDPKDYENWRMKRVPYLERVIKINLGKINFIMKTVRRNCLNGNFNPSWTGNKSWGKRYKNLRLNLNTNHWHIHKNLSLQT